MDADPPPDPNPDPSNPTIVVPLEKYTTDVAGSYIGGAAIRKKDDCTGGNKTEEHMWVSNILPSNVKLTGDAAADLFSETVLGGTGGYGKVCITVKDVPGTLKADGSVNGTVFNIGNKVSYEQNPWPYGGPADLDFTFRFLDPAATYYTVAAGRRIGIYLTSEKKLLGQDLTVVYDHPDYPSSVTLLTTP
jgi:hypothetical protein